MTSALVRPRRASTVALLRRRGVGRGPEVLLTHRPSTMAFGPGLHVFPGGAVDPGDTDASLARRSALDALGCARAWAGDLAPDAALAHALAALRELYEEAGILLADRRDGLPIGPGDVAPGVPFASLADQLDLVLRTDLLVPLAHWVTPSGDAGRRYDTRFYVAALPAGAEVAPDAREVVAHDWWRPADALRAAVRGEIDLWPPTRTVLHQLADMVDVADVATRLAPVRAAPPPAVEVVADGLVRVAGGCAGGIPGVTVNTWLVGRERVVVVDPGDPNEEAAEAILGTIEARGGRVAAVVVTGALADHVGGAVGIAIRTGAPILGSPAAAALVGDPATVIGERVDLGDIALAVREVPGGDADGLLALEAPSIGAVLVGDLGTDGPSRGRGAFANAGAPDEAAAFLAGLPGRRLPAHG